MNTNKDKIREKLALTKDEARRLIRGNLDGYETVEEKIIDTTRWSIITEVVVRRLSDGKFFSDSYSSGATESQDESPYDNDDPNFTEVFPIEKVIISYE
jgi:hypothetical protein